MVIDSRETRFVMNAVGYHVVAQTTQANVLPEPNQPIW